MIEKFESYLSTLPLTGAIRTRINEVLILNDRIISLDIEDIFICEMKNKEGERTYTSLWLFTDTYCMECENFLTTEDFDIVVYKKKVKHAAIKPIEFDFLETSSKSSIQINCYLTEGTSCNLIGTETNCMQALKIYQKYFLANLLK